MNLKHLIILLYFLALTLAVYAECGDNNNYDAYNKCPTPTSTLIPTPTSKCCQVPGGPGWENKVHAFNTQGLFYFVPKSPQDCCQTCLKVPSCVQWEFRSTPIEDICYYWVKDVTIDVCNFMEVNTTVADGGILHCNNGGC
ncbi:12796_t:CDS:1 [Cetraspora pellucida]|uniref:12796_t:CDS:1 n=1 Tax=Cetraspora pellucida TaxID=1433469 RepID=A0ACA9L8V9_9GLOM|nr:12796_t:CDS:1 [Cetraspora pellucida]